MNKVLFYLVMVMLIATSLGTLMVAGVDKNPTEFMAILIACLALTDVFLTIMKSWGMWVFLGLIIATGLSTIFVSAMILAMYPPVFANFDIPWLNNNTIVYGTRLVSLVWPIAVLIIGVLHYENTKKPEEEK